VCGLEGRGEGVGVRSSSAIEGQHGKLTTSPQQGEHIVLVNRLDLYHTPLDSGERQCKSRPCKMRFVPALGAGGKL